MLCGKIEGYNCDSTGIGALVARIKALGGTLDYVAMDEPLWFGHISSQVGARHSRIADLAHDIGNQVATIHRYFPNAQIGEIEPVTGIAGPSDYVSEVAQFADAYQAATGLPLAFFHSDVAWQTTGSQQQLQQLAHVARARGERFGIIYDSSNPNDATGVAWTTSAEQNFASIESHVQMVPDDAILQTWNAQPDHALPETQPGTMTYLIDRYVATETILSVQRTSHGFEGRLATHGGPVGNATIVAYEIADGTRNTTSTKSLKNIVPATAVSALVGLRINTECNCDGPVNILLGPATYVDNTSKQSAIRTMAPEHARLVLAAGHTSLVNSTTFPVTAGDTFTFSLPMQVPYSSSHSGYVAIIFLDSAGVEVARMELAFQPRQRRIWAGPTDREGRFRVTMPSSSRMPSIVRFGFSGSTHLRLSSTLLQSA